MIKLGNKLDDLKFQNKNPTINLSPIGNSSGSQNNVGSTPAKTNTLQQNGGVTPGNTSSPQNNSGSTNPSGNSPPVSTNAFQSVASLTTANNLLTLAKGVAKDAKQAVLAFKDCQDSRACEEEFNREFSQLKIDIVAAKMPKPLHRTKREENQELRGCESKRS
uniref:Uncharacterized protein n=1 Tax=Ditylenchus dipsaci TaxID=166011 RepID=A0A915DQZ3_9BILA